MKLTTAAEMREIDRVAREEFGMPEAVLMESAGCRVAEMMEELLGSLADRPLVIFAGNGNNGGDAMAAARHLLNKGARLKVFMTGAPDKLKPSPAIMYQILQKMGVEIHELEGERDWNRLHLAMKFAEGAVDGLVGTGFTGELRKKMISVIEEINASELPVVSVDIPSGVEADTGKVSTVAVKAAATLTLGLPKPGHFLSPGADCIGRLVVDDIGLPRQLLTADALQMNLLDDTLACSLLPARPHGAYKGSCGRILVVAGSRGMTGAAALAAGAALRAGAGQVTLAVPKSLQPLLDSQLTEVMVQPLPEETDGRLSGSEAAARALEMSRAADVLLIGPGLGRQPETQEFVRMVCEQAECPLILDADGIYAFGHRQETLAECKQIPVMTPHLGEMAQFLGVSVEELRGDLIPMAREAAQKYQTVMVVKSECTLVAYPDGDVFFTTKGNPGMATAGSGDVLAGTIAGLYKQTESGVAPMLGVYLHGLAGDMAAGRYAEGLVAGDILEGVALAYRCLREKQQEEGFQKKRREFRFSNVGPRPYKLNSSFEM